MLMTSVINHDRTIPSSAQMRCIISESRKSAWRLIPVHPKFTKSSSGGFILLSSVKSFGPTYTRAFNGADVRRSPPPFPLPVLRRSFPLQTRRDPASNATATRSVPSGNKCCGEKLVLDARDIPAARTAPQAPPDFPIRPASCTAADSIFRSACKNGHKRRRFVNFLVAESAAPRNRSRQAPCHPPPPRTSTFNS